MRRVKYKSFKYIQPKPKLNEQGQAIAVLEGTGVSSNEYDTDGIFLSFGINYIKLKNDDSYFIKHPIYIQTTEVIIQREDGTVFMTDLNNIKFVD